MNKEFWKKILQEGIRLKGQLQQISAKDRLSMSESSSNFLDIWNTMNSIYTKAEALIAGILLEAEKKFEDSRATAKGSEEERSIKEQITAANDLITEWAAKIQEYKLEIERLEQEKLILEQEVSVKRDNLREITSKPNFNITEVSNLSTVIDRRQKEVENKANKITALEKKILSESEGSEIIKQELNAFEIQLKSIEKKFDAQAYKTKLLRVFDMYYNGHTAAKYNSYTSVYDLFGVIPKTEDKELMKDIPRNTSNTRWQWGTTIEKKLTFKKIWWLKEIIDGMGVSIGESDIFEFQDVVYLYISDLEKGIIISDKKHNIVDREWYTHATFIIPGAPTFDRAKDTVVFPSPLLAKRIVFSDEDQWKREVKNWLATDNSDNGFKTKIITYNEDSKELTRWAAEKILPIGEYITDKQAMIDIIKSRFPTQESFSGKLYNDFAIERNKNPQNTHRIKETMLGLKNVLGITRNLWLQEYYEAIIYGDTQLQQKLEEEHDNNIKNVYSNEELCWKMEELLLNGVLHEGILGYTKFKTTFVNNCVAYIENLHDIKTQEWNERAKSNMMKQYLGINANPAYFSSTLGWVRSTEEDYQILLVQKFRAFLAWQQLAPDIAQKLADKEEFLKARFGRSTKNKYAEDEDDDDQINNKEQILEQETGEENSQVESEQTWEQKDEKEQQTEVQELPSTTTQQANNQNNNDSNEWDNADSIVQSNEETQPVQVGKHNFSSKTKHILDNMQPWDMAVVVQGGNITWIFSAPQQKKIVEKPQIDYAEEIKKVPQNVTNLFKKVIKRLTLLDSVFYKNDLNIRLWGKEPEYGETMKLEFLQAGYIYLKSANKSIDTPKKFFKQWLQNFSTIKNIYNKQLSQNWKTIDADIDVPSFRFWDVADSLMHNITNKWR